MKIRTATNADSEEIIALISSIYDEYGEVMYTDGADKDLLDINHHYQNQRYIGELTGQGNKRNCD